jgi:membrane dipeptidase
VPASMAGDIAVTTVLEQIDRARRMIAAYPQALELALTAADVFVSQECADWLTALKEFTASKGLDPRNFGDIRSVEPEWKATHPAPGATLSQVADHIEHVRSVAGIEHVGIGADFDGTTEVTEGLEDVSTYPALFAELLRRGWSESDCRALAGGNILRVLRAAESYAAR